MHTPLFAVLAIVPVVAAISNARQRDMEGCTRAAIAAVCVLVAALCLFAAFVPLGG